MSRDREAARRRDANGAAMIATGTALGAAFGAACDSLTAFRSGRG